jgi:predicted hexulose-6-phosphate isomerase
VSDFYRLDLYEKSMPGTLSLRQKLEETGKAGFDYLELSIDETGEKLDRFAWTSEISALCRDMEETGIPVLSICLSGYRHFPLGDPDPIRRQRGLEIMEKALRLASRLGVRIIQTAGYGIYYGESNKKIRDLFRENLERSVAMAAREGVMLAFETMETPFIDTVEKASYWVRRFESPTFRYIPTGNITNAALIYHRSAAEDLEKGRGHLAALHLKESGPGVYREIPCGKGHVDFAALEGTALRLGVRLFPAGKTEFFRTGSGIGTEVLRVRKKEWGQRKPCRAWPGKAEARGSSVKKGLLWRGTAVFYHQRRSPFKTSRGSKAAVVRGSEGSYPFITSLAGAPPGISSRTFVSSRAVSLRYSFSRFSFSLSRAFLSREASKYNCLFSSTICSALAAFSSSSSVSLSSLRM